MLYEADHRPAPLTGPAGARRLNAYELEIAAAIVRCITAGEIYRVSGQLPAECETTIRSQPQG